MLNFPKRRLRSERGCNPFRVFLAALPGWSPAPPLASAQLGGKPGLEFPPLGLDPVLGGEGGDEGCLGGVPKACRGGGGAGRGHGGGRGAGAAPAAERAGGGREPGTCFAATVSSLLPHARVGANCFQAPWGRGTGRPPGGLWR